MRPHRKSDAGRIGFSAAAVALETYYDVQRPSRSDASSEQQQDAARSDLATMDDPSQHVGVVLTAGRWRWTAGRGVMPGGIVVELAARGGGSGRSRLAIATRGAALGGGNERRHGSGPKATRRRRPPRGGHGCPAPRSGAAEGRPGPEHLGALGGELPWPDRRRRGRPGAMNRLAAGGRPPVQAGGDWDG
jgi:hypothetical protein